MSRLLPPSAQPCRAAASLRAPCRTSCSQRWAVPPSAAVTAAAAAARRLHAHGACAAHGRARQQQQRQWRRHAGGSASGPGSGEGEGIDIDALAAALAREAEKLRQSGASLSSEDLEEDEDAAAYEAQPDAGRQEAARREAGMAAGAGPDLLSPFGYASKAAEADVLAAVGEGCFSPEEFELLSELGTINIQQASQWPQHCSAAARCLGASPLACGLAAWWVLLVRWSTTPCLASMLVHSHPCSSISQPNRRPLCSR